MTLDPQLSLAEPATTWCGVDVSTKRLALVYLPQLDVETWSLDAGRTQRLASAYRAGQMLVEDCVVLCENPPYVRNYATYADLQRVLGAFLAGCYAGSPRWIFEPIAVSQWKIAALGEGNGNASKFEVATVALHRYPELAAYSRDQDVFDAVCIANACRLQWAARREVA